MTEFVLRYYILENIVTMTMTAFTVVSLYALGAGGYCAWGAIFLLNMNTLKAE